ncbi:unnamed protein product [Somion occarium]|uniref:Uncharacterized protein n=1 Tax=Somion occarium TaxID=3059160 RepID=A0ABP1DUK7_9APHY
MTSGWSPSFGEYIDTTVAVSDQSRGPAVSKSAVGNYVLNGTIYVGQYVTHKESVDGRPDFRHSSSQGLLLDRPWDIIFVIDIELPQVFRCRILSLFESCIPVFLLRADVPELCIDLSIY